MQNLLLSSLIYLIVLGIIVFVILYIYYHTKKAQQTSRKFLPFAAIPEIKLSENQLLTNQTIISDLIGDKKSLPGNPMIYGDYRRFPLNQKQQRTSVVAVDASNLNPNLAAWHVQFGVDGLNGLWPDTTSSYWVCPVNVKSHPVVVLKGSYPRARYFSIYSYAGIDENDLKAFGKGLTKWDVNNVNVCNSSISGDCSGLRDTDIEPDDGSKNPFVDKTYNPRFDQSNYTIYLVSPDYKGLLPKSKNILPLTTNENSQALILFRVYAAFNPNDCDGVDYFGSKGFDTTGCKNIPENNRIKVALPGGTVDPSKDKLSPCSATDKTCLQQGINYEFGKSMNPDCYQYVGNNQYCVCEGDNPTSDCGQYLDGVMRYYSNGKGGLSNYCDNAPKMADGVSYCIDDIQLDNGKMGKDVSTTEDCGDDNKCKFVKRGKIQQCVAKKLYESKNPACMPYKDPLNLKNITKKKNNCKNDFANMILDCSGFSKKESNKLIKDKADDIINIYVKNQPPSYNYTPDNNFETCPPSDCKGKCNQFTCERGYCIPRIGGEFTDDTCGGQCPKCKLPKKIKAKFKCSDTDFLDEKICIPCRKDDPDCKYENSDCNGKCDSVKGRYACKKTESGKVCLPDKKGKFATLKDCVNSKCMKLTKENYTSTFCKSNIGEINCSPYNNKLNDISNNYMNSQDSQIMQTSGWVGLPDVFVKYSWNDYFIRLNNYVDNDSSFRILRRDVNKLQYYIDFLNTNDPLNAYEVKEQNPEINITKYASSLVENFETDRKINRLCEHEKECKEYVDPDTYFSIGTRYPSPNILNRNNTKLQPPIGCNYYKDICDCESKQKLADKLQFIPGECGLQSVLQTNGKPCFSKWSLTLPELCILKNREKCHPKDTQFKFSGSAVPFFISGNTSDVIIFPNPDTGYLGAMTQFNDKYVYVIWMDVPTTPATPGFDNIVNKDYQMRYWSIGNYYYGLSPTNPRPVLSSVMDTFTTQTRLQYVDQKTGKKITRNRVCIVLANAEQYSFMKKFQLWNDDKLTWLNWGNTKSNKLISAFTRVIERRKASFANDMINEYMNTDYPSHEEDMNQLKKIQKQTKDLDDVNVSGSTTYSFIIYRQMLANKAKYKKSIENYVLKKPDCLNKNIQVKDEQHVYTPSDKGVKSSVFISKNCNPGPAKCYTEDGKEQDCKDKYPVDPCCVAKEPLDFMEEYYPRCERVKICDILNSGPQFWSRYTDFALPYKFDNKNPDATAKPSVCSSDKS